MTVLVCMTPEDGGWVMRRWSYGPPRNKLDLTHEGSLEGTMFDYHVRTFRDYPPAETKAESYWGNSK